MYVDCAFSIVANQWLNDCLIEIIIVFLIENKLKVHQLNVFERQFLHVACITNKLRIYCLGLIGIK